MACCNVCKSQYPSSIRGRAHARITPRVLRATNVLAAASSQGLRATTAAHFLNPIECVNYLRCGPGRLDARMSDKGECMKKETATALDAIFAAEAQRAQERVNRKQLEQSASDEFQAAFTAAADAIIEPGLQDVSQYLLKHGQRSRVAIETEESVTTSGRKHPSVTLRLLFDNDHAYRTSNQSAHFSIGMDRNRKEVTVYENTMRPPGGGQAGMVGSFPLQSVTVDFVQEKAFKWLAKVFRE